MIDKNDIREFVEQEYSSGIVAYDYSDHIRVTNGSAGFFANITIRDNTLHVTGRRYEQEFDEHHDRSRDGLNEALLHLGL